MDNIDFSNNREDMDVELIIGELWEGNDWNGSPEEAKRNIKAVLNLVKGKVSGVFILDSGRDYIQLFPESFESTITKFYQEF